jgi:uridine kinase
MNNFFVERDYREKIDVGSMGRQSIHFELFKQCLTHIKAEEKIHLPQLEVCDIAADTTNAALYVAAEIAEMLGS